MKKISCFLIIFLLTYSSVFSQEDSRYKTAVENFMTQMNSADYDGIFASFSAGMQSAMPLERVKEFFGSIRNYAGMMAQVEYLKVESGYHFYKATFVKAVYEIKIALDQNSKIIGFYLNLYKEEVPEVILERNVTKLILPFHGEWTVVWGGDTPELNYHVKNEAQKHAFDVHITNEFGRSYRTDGKTNEDYYAFGQELIAPCEGEVVLVVDGIKDNVPGVMNPTYLPGNTVIIKTDQGEYLFFAHFKQHSIVVKQGQRVKQGDLLGLCGNSGNSSGPHLHFHIQHVEDLHRGVGIKCYFENLMVDGQVRKDYSPIRGEKIKNGKPNYSKFGSK